jgi:hypothetical protein
MISEWKPHTKAFHSCLSRQSTQMRIASLGIVAFILAHSVPVQIQRPTEVSVGAAVVDDFCKVSNSHGGNFLVVRSSLKNEVSYCTLCARAKNPERRMN